MMIDDDKQSWKRMSFKGNKVWAALGPDEKFDIRKGKVLIKYNLKQDYQYRVRPESLAPEDQAVPKKIKDKKIKKNQGQPNESIKKKPKKIRSFLPDLKQADKLLPDKVITIYTDGACSGNPGPAGIGVYMVFGPHEKEISESIGMATNNVAELKAIKRALGLLKRRDLPVRIYTDSNYSLGLLTKGWKPKQNVELVESIKALMKRFDKLLILKVKGHAGIDGNERADRLATTAIKK